MFWFALQTLQLYWVNVNLHCKLHLRIQPLGLSSSTKFGPISKMAALLRGEFNRSIFHGRPLVYRTSFKTNLSNSTEASKEAPKETSESDWFNRVAEGDIDERVVPKPVSVMPDHLPQLRKRQHQKPWWKFRYFVDIHTPPLDTEEYTQEPQYPPIFDSSKEGIKKQIRLEWYNAIRRLPSGEQKIYEITKHYGHLSYILEPVSKLYNSLAIQQGITRTHLMHSLPESYNVKNTELDENLKLALLSSISNRLFSTKSRKATLEFKKSALSRFGFTSEENFSKSAAEEDILADVAQVVRNFNSGNVDLANIQVDYNANVATSWWVNDFPIPFKKSSWYKEDTRDQCFTYKSTHALHIRSEFPLQQSIPFDDELCTSSSLPECNYNLLKLGYPMRRHNMMSLPGFWPSKSEQFDFPYLIGHSRELLRARQNRNEMDFNDTQDVLDGMAIMSSFAWLTSVANNLGFSIYDHLTYPLATQAVITDGQYWSFYVFQLNNHAFHSDIVSEKSVPNLCWSSGDLKLFETYENGAFTGINDDVLKILTKFLTAPTKMECNYDLRPYLGVDERSQQEKDELSYSLRRKFINHIDTFVARRKKTNLWETIYKNHNEAPVDVKRIRPKLEFKFPPFFK